MIDGMSSKRSVFPRIIGHRGACGLAPENTLASFKAAAQQGVECVEFDTRLSKDDTVVIFHDDTLDRTTNGAGPVNEHDVKQLQRLDFGSWFGSAFTGERLLTFKGLIEFLDENEMLAIVEIKPAPGQERETAVATCNLIRDSWPGSLPVPVISSFKDACLAVSRSILPNVERALLIEENLETWERRAGDLECSSVHIWHEMLDQATVKSMTSIGYTVRTYTVNDPERGKVFLDWGVEGLCTDFPDRFADL